MKRTQLKVTIFFILAFLFLDIKLDQLIKSVSQHPKNEQFFGGTQVILIIVSIFNGSGPIQYNVMSDFIAHAEFRFGTNSHVKLSLWFVGNFSINVILIVWFG